MIKASAIIIHAFKRFIVPSDCRDNRKRSQISLRMQFMSPQRKSLFPDLCNKYEQKTHKNSIPYRIRVSSEDLGTAKNILRTPQKAESAKCYRFFKDSETNISTSVSDTEQAKIPSFYKTASKVGLSPIPLIQNEDIDIAFESMRKQQKRINESFYIPNSENDDAKNGIIKAFEFGFIKNKKRSVLNLKLHQIKESTNRSEAIQSVLEYTIKERKSHITSDLKQLEKEIRINKIENALLDEQIDEISHNVQFKSHKNISEYEFLEEFDSNRRKSHKIMIQ